MGASGHSIFFDDVAKDVRDEWVEAARTTKSSAKATAQVLKSCRLYLKDSDEGPVVWLALALTLHRHGCLTQAVKPRALQVLKEKQGLDRWTEAGAAALRKREHAYAAAERQLKARQPARHLPPPAPKPRLCPFKEGEIIELALGDGQTAYLKVLAVTDDRFHSLGLLDGPPREEHTDEAWSRVPLRWFTHRHEGGEHAGKVRGHRAISVSFWGQRDVPRKDMRVVGRCAVTAPERRCAGRVLSTGFWAYVPTFVAKSLHNPLPEFEFAKWKPRNLRKGARPTEDW